MSENEYRAYQSADGSWNLERDSELLFEDMTKEQLFEQLSIEMERWDTFELVNKGGK